MLLVYPKFYILAPHSYSFKAEWTDESISHLNLELKLKSAH